jgi:hypothetical protein
MNVLETQPGSLVWILVYSDINQHEFKAFLPCADFNVVFLSFGSPTMILTSFLSSIKEDITDRVATIFSMALVKTFACILVFKFLLHSGRCTVYNLTAQNLKEVPEDIPPNATGIDLSDNFIAKIHQSDFNDKFPDLFGVDLSDNLITEIEDGCFKGTKLSAIFLTNNNLKKFPDFSEVGDSVAYVYLENNQIEAICEEDITSLNQSSLLILLFQGNPFVYLLDLSQLSVYHLNLTNASVPC